MQLKLAALIYFTSISAMVCAQTVSGRITDSDGNGFPGINVVIKGTSEGTTTDIDGNFTIEASPEDVLVFSYIGFSSTEFSIPDSSNKSKEVTIDNGSMKITLQLSDIYAVYWCCTSHDRPHCDRKKSELKKTHSSSEVYVRKR